MSRTFQWQLNGCLTSFCHWITGHGHFPELKKLFYKEHSNVTWEDFLTTKFGLWIDTRLSIDNTLHCSGRRVKKSMLLQIGKGPKASGCDHTCYVFSLEDAVAHLNVTNSSGILTIEK